MNSLQTFDLSPFARSVIGIDKIERMFNSALEGVGNDGYPPFNITQEGEMSYRIELAVAGFTDADLSVTVKDNTLTIKGARKEEAAERTYLHRGIANRAFERSFTLADHVFVEKAGLKNGMLEINLRREVPEEKKPREIIIEI
jgi:Molecular chaperone (small heat shock protein)